MVVTRVVRTLQTVVVYVNASKERLCAYVYQWWCVEWWDQVVTTIHHSIGLCRWFLGMSRVIPDAPVAEPRGFSIGIKHVTDVFVNTYLRAAQADYRAA